MADIPLLPVTSTLTAALLIFLVVLSAMVTARRAVLGGIQFGDNADDALRGRIRAHGNFAEIVPMVILGLGTMEYAGATRHLPLGRSLVAPTFRSLVGSNVETL